jgi:hypothetical protein
MDDPREEIEQILNYLLPFAERMLSSHGEFYPYAATMDVGGEVQAVSAAADEQASRGAIRASGIAADVTLTDPDSGDTTDAVQLELDHAETDAVDVYVPYTAGDEGIEFGELVAAAGQAPIFSAE